MSEQNKIVYVGGKDSQNFRARKFAGYGQVLQICCDAASIRSLAADVDGVSGSLHTSDYPATDGQQKVDRGFPSIDGDEKCVAVAWPEDSKFGVNISGLMEGDVTFQPPKFKAGDFDKVIENMKAAMEFCEEFKRRKAELLDTADLYPAE